MPEEGAQTTEQQQATDVEPETDDASIDWKSKAREWEKRAKDNTAKLKEATPKLAEYDRLVAASKSKEDQLSEKLTAAEARAQQFALTAVKSRIVALAADDYANPSDAALLLDAEQYIDENGQIDDVAIKAALKVELDKRPNWRREAQSRIPAPNRAQGASGGATAGTASDQMNALIRAGRP